jgi:hypothetical protein
MDAAAPAGIQLARLMLERPGALDHRSVLAVRLEPVVEASRRAGFLR